MITLATDSKQLIYIYSAHSAMGKRLLPYAKSVRKKLQEINLDKTGLSQTVWSEIMERLNSSYLEIVDPNHNIVKQIKNADTLSEHDWLKLLDKNPELIQRPIIILGTKIVQADDRFDFAQFLGADGSNMDKSPDAIKSANHKDTTGEEKF